MLVSAAEVQQRKGKDELPQKKGRDIPAQALVKRDVKCELQVFVGSTCVSTS